MLLDEPDHDGVDRLMVIDGQQRLLTLATGIALAENRLNQQGSALVNEGVAFASRPRVQPAAVDDADFAAILRGEIPTSGGHLARAAQVISEALGAGDPAEILTGLLDQAQVVRVILDTREDAATVFESLNTTGLPLSQGDLVRTALLAAFGDLDAQRKVDDRYWRPMEARLRDAVPDRKKFERYSPKDRVVDDYLRAYLMRTGQGIESGRLYPTFVERSFSRQHARTETESEAALVSLDKLAKIYVGLIPPRATTLNSGVHQRIREIGYSVHFPLMLQLHERAAAGEVEAADIDEIAATLESFFIRRIVAGWPTNLLYRLFDRICLARPSRRDDLLVHLHPHIPSDARFRQGLIEAPMYRQARTGAMLILQRIEGDLGHLESHLDPEATVEHVMPQTIGDDANGKAWQAMLGSDWQAVHERWLHTLGNLTVTRYNSNMSNRPFVNPPTKTTKDKRTWLGESHFEMNRRIAGNSAWTAIEIEERSNDIADRGLRLWPLPPGEVGIF